jgi:hypothetical protein
MSAIPLFDYVMLSDRTRTVGSGGDAPLTHLAASLVDSSLHQFAQAHDLDQAICREAGAGFNEKTAVFVRLMFEDCVNDAEQVLERIEKVERLGHRVEGAERLRDEVGRVRAMLSVSPEAITGAKEQVRRGGTHPASELRHELQHRV